MKHLGTERRSKSKVCEIRKLDGTMAEEWEAYKYGAGAPNILMTSQVPSD